MCFLQLEADHVEVYVDGKLVFCPNKKFGSLYGEKQTVRFTFDACPNENAEFRILLHETDARYGGMRDGVELFFSKK